MPECKKSFESNVTGQQAMELDIVKVEVDQEEQDFLGKEPETQVRLKPDA